MLKKGTHHHNAQGVIGLLIVGIGFVLFYKLATNQDLFTQVPTTEATTNQDDIPPTNFLG